MKDTEIRKKLEEIISGPVVWDKEVLDCYSTDSGSHIIRPKVIVIPANKKDVIKTVKFAAKNKIGITARGGATGLVGGAVGPEIIMDLKKLDRLKAGDDYVTAECGVTKGKLDSVLEKKGMFLGPNPSVGPYCTIGGMIGTNASGSRSLKYGSMIDSILEIEFIDGMGNTVRLPQNHKMAAKICDIARGADNSKFPDVTKNSCGYRLDAALHESDAQKIMAASEGTLGIIISAKIRIHKIPKHRRLAVFGYDSVSDAIKECKKILQANPAALEFVDEKTLRNINGTIPKSTKCLLFVETDGITPRKIKTHTGRVIKESQNNSEIKKWWRYRDLALSYSLKNIAKTERAPHIIEDATVPPHNIAKLFLAIEKINYEFKTRCIVYGHIGNANLHVRLITTKDDKFIKKIAARYFTMVRRLGGTITGEHGDGIARTEFIRDQYGDQNYVQFKRLKRLLDPSGIMNPDKIIS